MASVKPSAPGSPASVGTPELPTPTHESTAPPCPVGSPAPGGRRRWLRRLRVGVGTLVLGAFLWIFTDAWESVPPWLARGLASTQFVPSLLAWAAGTGMALAAASIVVASLLCGRVYCAVLCPLGLFQDAVWRLRQWLRPRKRLLYVPEARKLRWGVFWICAVGAVFTGGVTLAWLDPYSLFGRLGMQLLRPIVVWVGNELTPLAHAVGWGHWYRVESLWHWGAATAVVLAMTAAILGLAAARGRLYCNTICPVGTLLGWLARRARWRLELSPALCRKCGECLQVCKAQCIDLRRQALDYSRCILCLDCLAVCPERGVHFVTGRRTGPQGGSSPVPVPTSTVGPSRRRFLLLFLALVSWPGRRSRASESAGTPEGAAPSVVPAASLSPACPPGSRSVSRFLRQCTACGLCVAACPTRVLQPAVLEYGPAGLLRPRMDYHKAYCNYECHRCGEVCPTGAIVPLPLEEKKLTKIGEVELTLDLCVVVTKGTDCVACSEHCPTQAVFPKPYKDHLRVPAINPALCIGCGACEFACPVRPVRAIRVRGWAEHGRAEKWADTPAAAPAPREDFPF
ncbi:4Fe-4S dicluster domain-containing protein [Limisphaera sp. VF-2]|uniref:4Fe-4S dicluster domain-containing protein n=1 Tax=Limisphaera sp. VF-2 TaxID=3400418 RepID=UPI0017602A5E